MCLDYIKYTFVYNKFKSCESQQTRTKNKIGCLFGSWFDRRNETRFNENMVNWW